MKVVIPAPWLGFIIGTRAALAFGVGLLLADRIPRVTRSHCLSQPRVTQENDAEPAGCSNVAAHSQTAVRCSRWLAGAVRGRITNRTFATSRSWYRICVHVGEMVRVSHDFPSAIR